MTLRLRRRAANGVIIRPDVRVHLKTACVGEFCVIHNPSQHKMQDWPIFIRLDRFGALAERVCTHGVGHPDPDSLAYILKLPGASSAEGVHGCDGCCG